MCAVGLSNIVDQLADGGFLLAYEITRPFACFAWGLDKRSWEFTDEREFGLWMSRDRWHAQLAAAGLVLVTEHMCAHTRLQKAILLAVAVDVC